MSRRASSDKRVVVVVVVEEVAVVSVEVVRYEEVASRVSRRAVRDA